MADIHYSLAISEEALAHLRRLPREQRQRIGARLTQLQDNLSGDVKKLTAKEKSIVCVSATIVCSSGWKAEGFQCMQSKTGKKLMSNGAATLTKKGSKITLQSVYNELVRLRERVEDLEDLRELNAAIARNKSKKLIAWEAAKKELGLDE